MANDERATDEMQGETNDDTRGATDATVTLTRALSEADLALFALVMGEVDLTTPPPMPHTPEELEEQPEERAPQAASPALLAALLTTAAAQLGDRPMQARVLRIVEMRLLAPAYTGETLVVSATITAHDAASGERRIAVRCATADGRQLAEADLLAHGGPPDDASSAR